jgi:protein-tyrosine phosphatase
MAAGLYYDRLAREGRDGQVRVRSAGVWALEGHPAAAYAQQVMEEHDLDISAHRGRNVTQTAVDEADLILTMSRRQASILKRDFGRSKGKVYLLSEMAGPPYDIEDPYGSSIDEYRQTAAELKALIENGYPRIMELLAE